MITSVRKTVKGFNVYIQMSDGGKRVRFATLETETEAERLKEAIDTNKIDADALHKRVVFALEGMIPLRVLRIFNLQRLIFLQRYENNGNN